jgi:hypothetical protein
MITLAEMKEGLLDGLARHISTELEVPLEHMLDRFWRGKRAVLARQIFTLVATDAAIPKGEVAFWLGMDASFITHTRNRHYKLRETENYRQIREWFDIQMRGMYNAKTG